MQDIVKAENNLSEIQQLEVPFAEALDSIDDIVLKKYLMNLSNYEIVPVNKNNLEVDIQQDIRLFKIDEMVYEKSGFVTDKFATLFSTFSNSYHSFFLLINSDGEDIDLYFGINTNAENISSATVKEAFESTLKSQFPGIKTSDVDIHKTVDISENLLDYRHVSSYSGVAFDRNDDSKDNDNFIQGLEKFLSSMDGKEFSSIILATPVSENEINSINDQLTDIYTDLSAFKTSQLGYTLTKNENLNTTETDTTATGTSISDSFSKSISIGTSDTEGESKGAALSNALTAVGTLAGGLATTALIVGTAGAAIPVVAGVAAAGTGLTAAGILANKQVSKSTTKTQNVSDTESKTEGSTYNESKALAKSIGFSTGDSQSLTVTKENKKISNILDNIDEQLDRQETFKSTGAFSCAAYFFSNSNYEADFAASSYQALVSGEKTVTETSTTNIWLEDGSATEEVKKYLSQFTHPVFKYKKLQNLDLTNIEVTPVSVVSGRELAIHMGLPRKSVGNFPVIDHAVFGNAVLKYDNQNKLRNSVPIGNIYNLGAKKNQLVNLDIESLAMHTFITGATGSGKSNTTYLLLEKLINRGINFLVIEPAKGEYKHIFGNRKDVSVYGTNPSVSNLLRINPFYFPEGIHVLEHVDKLVEIFNVCWPMYAAMPAILKEAILNSYSTVGWDLITSKCIEDKPIFPNFIDLEVELEKVIEASSYSADTKGDYTGALVTRVHSLSTGLNQFIFTNNELDDSELFDENVIIDLSRIGSSETKSLIMGLLVIRLNEYRTCQAQKLGVMNQKLRHITVIEEAHNLLKRTSQEQSSEGANMVGKSVEMLSNSIAEMRTYGEGFVIVDQSPTSVDISAIKNTNTKIIMRTPEYSDRELVGKSVGLNEEQIDEIIKLPKGVGVVFQNDWVEPVLCAISKAKMEEDMFRFEPVELISEKNAVKNILTFLLDKSSLNRDSLIESADSLKVSSMTNKLLKELISEGRNSQLTKKAEVSLYKEILDIPSTYIDDLVIRFANEDDIFNDLFRLLREKYPYLSETNIEYLSLSIIRYYAETRIEFHKIYQILVDRMEEC